MWKKILQEEKHTVKNSNDNINSFSLYYNSWLSQKIFLIWTKSFQQNMYKYFLRSLNMLFFLTKKEFSCFCNEKTVSISDDQFHHAVYIFCWRPIGDMDKSWTGHYCFLFKWTASIGGLTLWQDMQFLALWSTLKIRAKKQPSNFQMASFSSLALTRDICLDHEVFW